MRSRRRALLLSLLALAGAVAVTGITVRARHRRKGRVSPPVAAAGHATRADQASTCGNLPMRCLDVVDRYLGDPAQAPGVVAQLEQVCKEGRADGCDALVPFLAAGAGVEKNPARALSLAKAGCDRGDPSACNNLGILYLGGVGVAKDEVHALSLFDELCRKENQPRACFNAAALYEAGPVSIRDPAKAADYYTRLCNFGDMNGCFALGNLFHDGRGVAQDEKKAKALYTLACRAKLQAACNNLKISP